MSIKTNNNYLKKNSSAAIYLLALLIPFNPKWLGFTILLFFLEQLIRRNFSPIKKYKEFINLKKPYLWLLLFYLMHFIGMTYSDNTDFGWMDIGMKASFAIFPILFVVFNIKFKLELLLKFFIVGAFTAVIVCFYLSYLNYAETGKPWLFRESYLSHFIHRSYWATYLALAFIFSIFLMVKKHLNIVIGVFVSILFFIVILILGSKAGIGILFISSVILFVYIIKETGRWKWVVGSGILGVIILFATLSYFPTVKNRINNGFKQFVGQHEDSEIKDGSTNIRMIMWTTSFDLIKEKPFFGVGTGDIKDALRERNEIKGNTEAVEKNMNSHSQFLNSWVAIGVVGVIFLFLFFLIPFLYPIENYIFISRIIIFVLFASLIAESFLETQAGIIPVSFLMCLIGKSNVKS